MVKNQSIIFNGLKLIKILDLLTMGGATGSVGGMTYPPLLWPVPHRGYNAIYLVHVRGTAAGCAAKVTQFTFGFSTWKFCFLYSVQFATTMTHKI